MVRHAEYLQLEPFDDVITIRDRFSFIEGHKALLILPRKAEVLTSKLDLTLLLREAKRRNIQIALVTSNPVVMHHAKELQISTFPTIAKAERGKWKRGKIRLFTRRFHRPSNAPDPSQLIPVASRIRNSRRNSLLLGILTRLLMFTFIIGIIGFVAYLFVPSATINVTARSETIQISTTIIADPQQEEVDVENQRIPAERMRVTVSTAGTVPATGAANDSNVPATGFVALTNLTNSPLTIPQNTTLVTSTGQPISFRTQVATTLNAGEAQEVNIEAAPGFYGEEGNVSEGLINAVVGPLEGQVGVQNRTATSGGGLRSLPTVAQADIDRLQSTVRGQLQSIAYTEIENQLEDTQTIALPTVRIAEERSDWIQFSHNIGDITEVVSMDMQAVVEVTVIDQRFVQQIAFANISADKPEVLIIQPDTFTITQEPFELIDLGSVSFEIVASAETRAEVDTQALAQQLATLPITEALDILYQDRQLSQSPRPSITITPDIVERLPILPFRIFIEVMQEI